MIALAVRLVIMFAVIGGATFGIAKAIRSRSTRKALKKIDSDIEALKAGDDARVWTPSERQSLLDDIQKQKENIDE